MSDFFNNGYGAVPCDTCGARVPAGRHCPYNADACTEVEDLGTRETIRELRHLVNSLRARVYELEGWPGRRA